MMVTARAIGAALLLVLAVVSTVLGAASPSLATAGKRVLVVHDPTVRKRDFSAYFGALEKQGLELAYRSVKDSAPALWDYDVPVFDHVLLFAPSAKSLPEDLTPQKLVTFLEGNGNVLFALSTELSEMYRDLAREFDVEFEEHGASLIDHVHTLGGDAQHTSVALPLASSLAKIDSIFGAIKSDLPFLYRGSLHRLGSNPLAFSLLKPTATSYSFDTPQGGDALSAASLERLDSPDRDVVFGSDVDSSLISAFQLLDTERRNPNDGPKRKGSAGRAVWVGSTDAFSNDFVDRKAVKTAGGESFPGTSNLAVLTSLTSWLTQQQGVLHVEATSHSRVKLHENDVRESYEEFDVTDEAGQHRIQRMYRIKDTVTFNIDLAQHTPTGWTPAPADLDLQVSLVMLDPYITTNLTASPPKSVSSSATQLRAEGDEGSPRITRYSTTFQLPDQHGVYTFIVDWKRHGWSYLHTRDTAPVRPFNHDEHPRGLHSAWPYVTGAGSTAVAFLAFCAIWMYSQNTERAGAGAVDQARKDE